MPYFLIPLGVHGSVFINGHTKLLVSLYVHYSVWLDDFTLCHHQSQLLPLFGESYNEEEEATFSRTVRLYLLHCVIYTTDIIDHDQPTHLQILVGNACSYILSFN
jgi:hypothetical protein